MLCQTRHSAEPISLATDQLLFVLALHKRKPYLPIWGELFHALREIAKLGQQFQENILIYRMQSTGTLWYRYRENQFLADLPNPSITISLTQEQLIDALITGSFAPDANH
ncbi:hypothetical protein [Brevibacillus sp. NRS-1366]|uniref:hypothetical protein n=1 Tax=Brevibacillus sp. NRS-1366 TaxID=3233899 RepID=UPI003D1E59A1